MDRIAYAGRRHIMRFLDGILRRKHKKTHFFKCAFAYAAHLVEREEPI
jgi:hypothetical protein